MLGGSLHLPHGAVEKNLTTVQEENMIGESFRRVSWAETFLKTKSVAQIRR